MARTIDRAFFLFIEEALVDTWNDLVVSSEDVGILFNELADLSGAEPPGYHAGLLERRGAASPS